MAEERWLVDYNEQMKIGFIGLGIMGSRMAANLQKRGHSLVVFNRTREKTESLVAGGAKWAGSPAALLSHAPELRSLVGAYQTVIMLVKYLW